MIDRSSEQAGNNARERPDVLTDVLSTTRLRSRVFCCSEMAAPWAMELPASPWAHFHVIERGAGWLRLPDSEPVPIAGGDLIIVPHGSGHILSDAPDTRGVPLSELVQTGSAKRHHLRAGGDGPVTQMICGAFELEDPIENPLLRVLPPLIHLRSFDVSGWLEPTIRMLSSETRERRPGFETILGRLTDVIFVQAVRSWVESQPGEAGGWLGALRDPRIAAALGAIHRAPGAAWTVSSLAAESGMSRSPFSARFTALVGVPPLTYVTGWRMRLAAARLRETSRSIADIALEVGYEAEAAFSRAFKRHAGMSPSAYRASTPARAA